MPIGKPEVVFDSGTRGGQARRSGSDDDQVVRFLPVDSRVQTKTGGGFGVGGIARRQISAASEHRDVSDANRELAEHGLYIGIALHVELHVGLAVARKEGSQA